MPGMGRIAFLGGVVAARIGPGDYWSGARRGRYLGLQTLVAALAATVFFAVGGLLGASGWRTPFWLYAVALVIVVPMAFLLWQPARPDGVRRTLEPVPWRALAGPCAVSFLGGVWFYALINAVAARGSGPGRCSSGSSCARC